FLPAASAVSAICRWPPAGPVIATSRRRKARHSTNSGRSGVMADDLRNRSTILGTIRRALAASGDDAERQQAVATRLAEHRRNLMPARAQLPDKKRLQLFREMLTSVNATH